MTDTGYQPHPPPAPAAAGVGLEHDPDQVEYCICRKLEVIEEQERKYNNTSDRKGKHSPESSPLDQLIYMDMLNFNHLLKKAQRADAIRAAYFKGTLPKIKTEITEEDVGLEILQKFGELDDESPKFDPLFLSFKETMQEEFAIFEEAEREELISGNISGFETVEQVRKKMDQWVIENKVDVEMYTNFDPRSNLSKAEWFDLPRPMEEWGQAYLESKAVSLIALNLQTKPVEEKEDKNVPSTDSTPAFEPDVWPPERDLLAESLPVLDNPNCDPQRKEELLRVNLAVFDPKYWNFPKNVSNRNEVSKDEEYFTPLKLCRTLNSLIHQCPLGISSDALNDLYFRTNGSHVTFNIDLCTTSDELDMEDYTEQFFVSLPDIFHASRPIIGGVGKTLLFPAAFKGLIATRRIFDARLTHLIVMTVILNDTGFLHVEEVPSLIWSHFGVDINPFALGYSSTLSFVKDYLSSLRSYVTFVEYFHRQGDTYEPKTFLILTHFPNAIQNFEAYRTQTEDPGMVELEKSRMKNLTLVEKHQAQMIGLKPIMRKVEEIEFSSDFIDLHGPHYCRCSYAISPSSFYVVLHKDFENLRYVTRKLENPATHSNCELPFNFLEEITIGSLVLAKVKPEENVWCRVVVISLPCVNENNPESGIGVKVRQLDYGGLFWVKLDEIAPLPRELGEPIRALAIHCNLQFHDKTLIKKENTADWTDKEREMFIEMVCGQNMKVQLGMPTFHTIMTPVGKQVTEVTDPYGKPCATFPARGNLHLPFPDVRLLPVTKAVVLKTKQPTDDWLNSTIEEFKTSKVFISDLAVEFEKWYKSTK
ncbi:uncharacterized protein LOC110861753 [Folsomia candida]|uniref:Tudor domain-containing protein n=1 Tax=Folsomia candida TaxID=158441 RepID=A0A226CYY0_FOLCA|nr:uncharacterized protein LOC110861753 [Folsomia candida]XP_035700869.1 uncharacterized protein LOC110861753 [Folsomia candida]OXA38512.1 hypothetical protein Fcan01_26747 [Folsomia candida]